ncbi:MAG: hypothetical protein V3T72_18455 [Thermoanaerobaculia bacterium]
MDITLTADDTFGGGLTFSIETGPTAGSLSSIDTTTANCDPPVAPCAVVTYTATVEGDEDSFTFRVTSDGNAELDIATVSINPDDSGEVPPPPTDAVVGKDDSLEVVTDTALDLTLVAFADVADPAAVGDFAFSIISGPTSGSLATLVPSEPTATDLAPPVPEELFDSVRTAETTYTPNAGFAGDPALRHDHQLAVPVVRNLGQLDRNRGHFRADGAAGHHGDLRARYGLHRDHFLRIHDHRSRDRSHQSLGLGRSGHRDPLGLRGRRRRLRRRPVIRR